MPSVLESGASSHHTRNNSINNNNMDVQFVPVTARHAPITAELWWSTAEEHHNNTMDYGAGPLVYRCMREYYWNKEYAIRVLKGYKQFLELKKILEDWDATILAPSVPVHQMWHQHILDVTNYCHDCTLLCGRIVGHDPDGTLDEWGQEKRWIATQQLLRARFEKQIDPDVWRFDEMSNNTAPPNNGPRDPSMLNVGGPPRAAPSFMSGLTADEKKYEQLYEEKKRHHHKKDHAASTGNPFAYQPYGSNVAAAMSGGGGGGVSKYHHRGGVMYDEKKEDDGGSRTTLSSSKSKLVKKDSGSVVIHDVKEKEIEVEEEKTFPIRVRTLKGSIYTLPVSKHMTVHEVKGIIAKEYGVPEDKQHLLFYGKVLEDRKTIEECAIPPESGLQLLVRSRRPMDMSTF